MKITRYSRDGKSRKVMGQGAYAQAMEVLERVSVLSGATFSNTSAASFGRLLLKNQVARKHTKSGNVYLVKDVKDVI